MKSIELNAPPSKIRSKRQIGFYIAGGLFVLLFVGMLTFVVPVLPIAITGWFSHTELAAHQIHDTLAAILLWSALVGVLLQAVRPNRQVGGMQQSLAVLLSINAAVLLGKFSFPPILIFLGLAVATAVFHPARHDLLPRFDRANWPLLGLALLAAIPLLLFASEQIRLQGLHIPNDTHAEVGHWALMGGYGIAILLLGLLAGLRPSGWRVPAWSAGLLAILMGFASLVLHGASALSPLWGVLAMVWGIVFIGASERIYRQ